MDASIRFDSGLLIQQRMDGVSKKLSSLQTTCLTRGRQPIETTTTATTNLSSPLRQCSVDLTGSPFLPTPRSLSGLSNYTGTDLETPTEDGFNPITSALRRTTRVPLYVHPYYWTHIHKNVLLSQQDAHADLMGLSVGSLYSDSKEDVDDEKDESKFDDDFKEEGDSDYEDDDEFDVGAAAMAARIHIPTPSINQYDRTEAIAEFEAGPSYSMPSIDDSLCSIVKSALWSLSDDACNGASGTESGPAKNPSIFLEDEDALWNRGCPPRLEFSFCGDEAPLPVDAVLKLRYPFHFEEVPVLAVIDRSEHLDRRYRFRKRGDRSKRKLPWPEEHRWDVPFKGVESLDPYILAVLLAIAQQQRSIADEHGQEMDYYTAHVVFPYTWIPPAPPAPPLPPRVNPASIPIPASPQCYSPISPLSQLHSPLSQLHSPLSQLHSPLSQVHSPLSLSPLSYLPPPPPLPSNPLLPHLNMSPSPRRRARSTHLPPESSPYPFHSCKVVTVSAKISDSYLDLLTKPSSPSDSPTGMPYPYPSFADTIKDDDETPFFKISIKTHTLLSASGSVSSSSSSSSSPVQRSARLPTQEPTSWFIDDSASRSRELLEEKELLEHLHGLVNCEAVRWVNESQAEPLLSAEGFFTPPSSDDEICPTATTTTTRGEVKELSVDDLHKKRRRTSGFIVTEEERRKMARI